MSEFEGYEANSGVTELDGDIDADIDFNTDDEDASVEGSGTEAEVESDSDEDITVEVTDSKEVSEVEPDENIIVEDSAVDDDIDFTDESEDTEKVSNFERFAEAYDEADKREAVSFKGIDGNILAIIFVATLVVLIVVVIIVKLTQTNTPDNDTLPEGSETTITTEATAATTFPVVLPDTEEVDPFEDFYVNSDRSFWTHFDNAVGQLYIEKLNMSYVVFQGADNEQYLNINMYGEEDNHGSIFGDYRNDFDNLDENNVIYGHNMADGSMFAGLLKMRDEAYFENEEDFYINFNSAGYNNIFKVFAVYETDLTSFNFIQTGFDPFSKIGFMSTIREKNELGVLNPDEVPDDAKVLTLSTCTQGGSHRFVVHAYLITRKVV